MGKPVHNQLSNRTKRLQIVYSKLMYPVIIIDLGTDTGHEVNEGRVICGLSYQYDREILSMSKIIKKVKLRSDFEVLVNLAQ